MQSHMKVILSAAAVLLAAGCNEMNRTAAPVELIATTQQNILVIDLLNPPQEALGTIFLRAIAKRDVTDPRFLDVQLRSYRVSYVRTDGGRLVPTPFVRTTSGIIPVGGPGQSLNNFQLLQGEALSQAPFVALLPNNAGVDPETGERVVKMNAIIEIFGQTLGGANVVAEATIPLWFCASCTT
jgi:hypothetical protein